MEPNFNVRTGMVLNQDIVESDDLKEAIHYIGSLDSIHYIDDYIDKETWDIACELGGFGEIWERDHEFKEITCKVESIIIEALDEYGLWLPKDEDSAIHCMPERNGLPVVVDSYNIEVVEEALNTASSWVGDAIANSWRKFLQIPYEENDGKEEFGKDWIPDNTTRLLLMRFNNLQNYPDLEGFDFTTGEYRLTHGYYGGDCFTIIDKYGEDRNVYVSEDHEDYDEPYGTFYL